MKKFKITAAIILVVALLFQAAPAVFAQDPEYTTKDIHIYRDSLDEDETVECRFYSDLPEVPYIDYEVYASVFNKDNMEITAQGDGQYLVYTPYNEEYALFDVANDTITFNNLSAFLYAPAMDEDAGGEFYYLDMGALDYQEIAGPSGTVVDLGAYGIDIREEDGKMYFPVPTLSDIYSAINQLVVYYNGEVLYYNSVIMSGGARDQDDACLSILVKNMNRSETLANYTYNEICFNVDNFFGFPCTNSPFMSRVEEVGLDAALKEYDPFCIELLLSEKSELHIAGMYRLFNFWLCDGGHTGAYMNDLVRTLYLDMDDYARVLTAIRTYGYPDTDYENTYLEYNDSYSDTLMNIYFTRGDAFGSEYYNEYGDTAMISFDEFDIDFDAWEAYFGGEGPFPGYDEETYDTFGFVYACLERAKQNPEIKNIVFDLSCNGGGYVAVYIAIVSLINVTADYNVYDRYTGECVNVQYITDRDFDGELTYDDLNPDYSMFNYAVLTSTCSFSCGNLFPSAMKDAGYMILGEQSGGGTCPLGYNSTAEGLEYIMSAGDSMLVNRAGENIDDGIPVHVDLVIREEDGSKDYSQFFNLALLSRYIRIYYGELVPGDLDGDGDVDMSDLLRLRKIMAGAEDLTAENLEEADVNGDGEVNMKDILFLRRLIAGLESFVVADEPVYEA